MPSRETDFRCTYGYLSLLCRGEVSQCIPVFCRLAFEFALFLSRVGEMLLTILAIIFDFLKSLLRPVNCLDEIISSFEQHGRFRRGSAVEFLVEHFLAVPQLGQLRIDPAQFELKLLDLKGGLRVGVVDWNTVDRCLCLQYYENGHEDNAPEDIADGVEQEFEAIVVVMCHSCRHMVISRHSSTCQSSGTRSVPM